LTLTRQQLLQLADREQCRLAESPEFKRLDQVLSDLCQRGSAVRAEDQDSSNLTLTAPRENISGAVSGKAVATHRAGEQGTLFDQLDDPS